MSIQDNLKTLAMTKIREYLEDDRAGVHVSYYADGPENEEMCSVTITYPPDTRAPLVLSRLGSISNTEDE